MDFPDKLINDRGKRGAQQINNQYQKRLYHIKHQREQNVVQTHAKRLRYYDQPSKSEADAALDLPDELAARIAAHHSAGFVLSASVEAEIAGLDNTDQAAFLDDLGLAESALARFIRAAYGLLDLISFFTVGDDEVRAWTIRRGTHARRAAGRIHSDLERGFIRAEVTPYEVFMEYGSESAVKDAGRLQIEGKDYVVSDGDILHVRFNV